MSLVGYWLFGAGMARRAWHPIRADGKTECGRVPYGLIEQEGAEERGWTICIRCQRAMVYAEWQRQQVAS